METSMKTNRRLGKVLTYTVLILGSIVMIFPFVWMVLTCFKTQAESMAVPPQILPSHWDLENFVTALQSLPFVNLYINTALLIVLRVICAVVFSSMAGYAFAKLNFPCKNLLFSIVLVQMMLPSQIFITPQYLMLARMGQTNTIFALVFPGIVSAFGTFFLRQTYLGIPMRSPRPPIWMAAPNGRPLPRSCSRSPAPAAPRWLFSRPCLLTPT